MRWALRSSVGILRSRKMKPISRPSRRRSLQHHLLCIRTDPLEPSAFARVARHFGEPQLQLLRDLRDGAVPEVSFLESTYKTPEDKPDDLTRVQAVRVAHRRFLFRSACQSDAAAGTRSTEDRGTDPLLQYAQGL